MIEDYLGAGDRQGAAVPIVIPVLLAGACRWRRECLSLEKGSAVPRFLDGAGRIRSAGAVDDHPTR